MSESRQRISTPSDLDFRALRTLMSAVPGDLSQARPMRARRHILAAAFGAAQMRTQIGNRTIACQRRGEPRARDHSIVAAAVAPAEDIDAAGKDLRQRRRSVPPVLIGHGAALNS